MHAEEMHAEEDTTALLYGGARKVHCRSDTTFRASNSAERGGVSILSQMEAAPLLLHMDLPC